MIPAPARAVVHATDVVFRYREAGSAILNRVSLKIERGDWVLLEGESGGGKSTLVSVLAGLREPAAGLLTSDGMDRRTLGAAAWRARVAAAPQYHENHILTGSLAFNLLLGRAWPPSAEDYAQAEQVCHELGLGGLLERMPGGLDQMVGETGWQLSQGERSRVFLARALLQSSDVVILDENFAALDPENLHQSMECTLRRATTLLVVAHP
jgi:ATP-binding cassette subfamily B protein